MIERLKSAALGLPFVRALWRVVKNAPQPAPHAIKQKAILELARRYNAKTLVETGTYMGDMVEAMKSRFDRVYSIELSENLYRDARARFAEDPNVQILHGDSGSRIADVLADISGPAIFWLDGHYSGGVTARAAVDTPVWAELERIFAAPDLGHVILIDDARLFGLDPHYPTVAEIAEFVKRHRPNLAVDVANDSIRLLPVKT